MDFFKIKTRSLKKGEIEIYPDFMVARSSDLMIRGKSFFAVWDEEKQLWSTDEYDVRRLVDKELMEYRDKYIGENHSGVKVKLMKDFSSNSWAQFRNYMSHISDNAHELDGNLTFADQEITKKDYVSKRLPYPLKQGTIDAWNKLIGTLYDPDERAKIEWAIGAIVAGEARTIQKFLVLYGEAGAGKSTILNIIQKLFTGYYTTFESKALGSNNNSFATEAFKGNPLVAIEHDGDLSRIEDNTKLNSIVAHEEMTMNEKYKPGYTSKTNCFLFIGTNKPVKITDGKSGIIRRLIDVRTSGNKIPVREYQNLIYQIDFELGAIAYHCLDVYRKMGKNYFSGYRPIDMMLQTDVFYNFVESNFYIFKQEDGIALSRAWEMYKTYCDETLLEHKLPRHKFREELKNYFKEFKDKARLNGEEQRSVYLGFLSEKFTSTPEEIIEEHPISLVLDSETSLFDIECSDYKAQYASNTTQLPTKKWANTTTKLSDLNTNLLHYVVLPENHIVIDFDLEDDNGEKSVEKNLEAASKWPPTYAEYSKSHKGIHLHYIYDGDPSHLSSIYSDGIEIKRTQVGSKGPSSLRRQLSKCNNIPIAHINSGLPLKGEKMIDIKAVTSEKALRELIVRNLNKEIHPGTKPSIDFIHKILEDAYSSGLRYDLTQMRPKVLAFAMNSTHQSEYCVGLVAKMKFQSEEKEDSEVLTSSDSPLVFYDTEVFPNLFIVCWKYKGKDNQCVRMINPNTHEIEGLMKMNLVGFNCRRYDNHILYARYLGYDNAQLFDLSSKIINNSQNGMFREAYNISYTDVYDFSSAGNKKSLKKWEIELGIHHHELGLPWDQPVPEELWHKVAEYCEDDTTATEVVFDHLKGDWEARKVLAELSGLSVNDTTNQHITKIVFGSNKNTQESLVYTDLSTIFPGYKFDNGKSIYRGEEVGEGGYVYAEPGIYENVVLLDVASMHPTSIVELNLLGKYTKRFSDLKKGRLAIKHNNPKELETLLDGKFIPFIKRSEQGQFNLKDLSEGLKTGLNSGYGLTYAHFDNPFKDSRNIDNIVAKRGALFMVDLKYAVQEKGFTVAHIKTDSIKIPNATKEIIDFVFEFGKKYGYTFEHEATYSKFCLVNDAVYIAKYDYPAFPDGPKWTATGAEFAHPYIFKTLFSKEEIVFSDLCETKMVKEGVMYLDMASFLYENDQQHNYQFIGKVGSFVPIKLEEGGGILLREKDGHYYAVTGTKGYRWLESEVVKELGFEDKIDMNYYKTLVKDAKEHISQFGNFKEFVK